MRGIGIIAALAGELKPLVRTWPRTDEVSIGWVGGTQCYAAAAGMGEFGAARAFAAIREAAGELDGLVSYGWAGALSCGVTPQRVYRVSEVVDSRTGERYQAVDRSKGNGAPAVRLLTLDHVARQEEKRVLAERYRASLVDMEAATVARLARAHAIPFFCLKGVSDGYNDKLPDFNRFLGRDGQLRMIPLVAHVLLQPRSLGGLVTLGRNSSAAAQGLAQALPGLLGAGKLVS